MAHIFHNGSARCTNYAKASTDLLIYLILWILFNGKGYIKKEVLVKGKLYTGKGA